MLHFTRIIPGHCASGRLTLRTNLARLCASPCLFQLGEHSDQQFVLCPQQELDRAEPLHHVLKYIVHLTFSSKLLLILVKSGAVQKQFGGTTRRGLRRERAQRWKSKVGRPEGRPSQCVGRLNRPIDGKRALRPTTRTCALGGGRLHSRAYTRDSRIRGSHSGYIRRSRSAYTRYSRNA